MSGCSRLGSLSAQHLMVWEPSPPSDLCGAADPSLPRSIPRPRSQARLHGKFAASGGIRSTPCPSRGEHHGRGVQGRRRLKPPHDGPMPTPWRNPQHRLYVASTSVNPPLTPRLLRRAEPGNPTQSVRRSHLPSPHHGPQLARNRGPFQARRQYGHLIAQASREELEKALQAAVEATDWLRVSQLSVELSSRSG